MTRPCCSGLESVGLESIDLESIGLEQEPLGLEPIVLESLDLESNDLEPVGLEPGLLGFDISVQIYRFLEEYIIHENLFSRRGCSR